MENTQLCGSCLGLSSLLIHLEMKTIRIFCMPVIRGQEVGVVVCLLYVSRQEVP